MFLFLYEDGSIVKRSYVDDEDKAASDKRLFEIIDLRGNEPLQYSENEWHEIDTLEYI